MSNLKIDYKAIIEAYNKGESMNSIARAFGTHATTIRRILLKSNVKLRADIRKKGSLYVQDGEKLIEWAKAQGRLVTKNELAKVLGKTKLSPSYFIKYPELGNYVITHGRKETQYYSQTLYAWLKQNGILYKPDDKKTIGVSVTALLLGEYNNLAIQLNIKPKCVSKINHMKKMQKIYEKAKDTDLVVIFIDENYFKDLNVLKSQLDEMKSLYK